PRHCLTIGGYMKGVLRAGSLVFSALLSTAVRGAQATASADEPILIAVFHSPQTPLVGQPVQFYAVSSCDRMPQLYNWGFGYGTVLQLSSAEGGASPIHTYHSTGQYNVRCTFACWYAFDFVNVVQPPPA